MPSTKFPSSSRPPTSLVPDNETFTAESIRETVEYLIPSACTQPPLGDLVVEHLRIRKLTAAHFGTPAVEVELAPRNFLELPAEIRNMIYGYCLVVGKVFPRPKPYQDERFKDYKTYEKPQTQMFQLCRQIFAECAPLYFAENQFVISYGTMDESWPWKKCPKAKYSLFRFAKKHVRSLSIAFDYRDNGLNPCDGPWPAYRNPYTRCTWIGRAQSIGAMKLHSLEVFLGNYYLGPDEPRSFSPIFDYIFRKLSEEAEVTIIGVANAEERLSIIHGIQRRLEDTQFEDEDPDDKLKVILKSHKGCIVY